MQRINITSARADLYKLVERTAETNEPVTIVGKKGSAVLISQADWDGLQETIYLNSIPGLVKSILEASQEPLEEGISLEEVNWDAL